jgi:hypothetical protein
MFYYMVRRIISLLLDLYSDDDSVITETMIIHCQAQVLLKQEKSDKCKYEGHH